MDEREAMFILHLKKYTTKVIQFIILHPQEGAPTPNSGLQNIIWERGSPSNTRSPVPALIWYVTQNKNLPSARRNSTLQTRNGKSEEVNIPTNWVKPRPGLPPVCLVVFQL